MELSVTPYNTRLYVIIRPELGQAEEMHQYISPLNVLYDDYDRAGGGKRSKIKKMIAIHRYHTNYDNDICLLSRWFSIGSCSFSGLG